MAPRSRFQRCFLAWLADADLAVPVTIERRSDKVIRLSTDRAAEHLEIIVQQGSIDAFAMLDGAEWDMFFIEDVSAVRTENGYACGLCSPEERRVWPSRESLWQDHLFEALRLWLAETLAPASFLAFYGLPERGVTWAKLHTSPADDDPHHVVELMASQLG